MPRPVPLFTGKGAVLPIEQLTGMAGGWGFDGVELAGGGDHFEVDRALADDAYCREKRALVEGNGLDCWALGAHLVGPAACGRIGSRHRASLSARVWCVGGPA